MMKTLEETKADPGSATHMEIICANFDILAKAARVAVENGYVAELRSIVEELESNTALVRQWLETAVS